MVIHVKTDPPIPKLKCLYDDAFMEPFEYILIHGGRGGGKTEEVARWLITNSFKDEGHVLCTREIQNSITDSVYAVLWSWIETMELTPFFHKTNTEFRNKITGARFIFRGMKSGTERDTLKSIKGIKFVWYEEAQSATAESLEKLNPTVRIPGRKLFFTFNPELPNDAVNSLRAYGDKVLDIEINFDENPYLPDVLREQAQAMQELHPELFKHVWLGKPRSSSDAYTVLPYGMLRRCIDAHKKLGNDAGHAYGGLDLAPGEEEKHDKNATSFIRGPVVLSSEHWQCSDLDEIANRVIADGMRHGIVRLYFDAVGVGGFANGTLKRKNPPFRCEPFMGGNAVFGPDRPFMMAGSRIITNKDFFKNAKSQQWWNLRLRMENTIKLLEGKPVARPEYYLSFDSSNPNLELLLIELSQATFSEDASGRVMIDKAPGDKEIIVDGKKKKVRSPNLADSCGQAFIRSCINGLRSN